MSDIIFLSLITFSKPLFMHLRSPLAAFTCLLAFCACGGDSDPARVPASISVTTSSSGTAGEPLTTPPTFTIVDADGEAIGGVTVSVTVTAGGGTLVNPPTKSSSGATSVGTWTLGQVAGPNQLTITGGGLTMTIDMTGNPGPVEQIDIVQGQSQTALAGTAVPTAIILKPSDKYHNAVPNQTVTFTVTAGGGGLASSSVQSGSDGLVTVPAWTLGKSKVAQTVQASTAGKTVALSAIVQSSYNIEVRFWGTPMTAEQQALFTTAAARISGFITGDIADGVIASGNPSSCGVTGQPDFNNDFVDDIIIYASIQTIDGPSNILAQAGPCFFRTGFPGHAALGVMEFDAADIGSLGSSLQDVIIHEMLHVIGFGTDWDFHNLLSGAGTASVAFTGTQARAGCHAALGTVTCASNVPVENTGGAGTRDSHWREATFSSELMTGFINAGTNPISRITIGSLGDMLYTVNLNAADSYTIPGGSLRAQRSLLVTPISSGSWEKRLPIIPRILGTNGHVAPLPAGVR